MSSCFWVAFCFVAREKFLAGIDWKAILNSIFLPGGCSIFSSVTKKGGQLVEGKMGNCHKFPSNSSAIDEKSEFGLKKNLGV